MKILAIDTSSVSGSVAVSEDGVLLGELNTDKVGTHSEWLLPQIRRLLSELDLKVADIDVFALSQGPGSFTGLRIGVSILKGLSWGGGGGHGGGEGHGDSTPIVGVSTLEALSCNLSGETSYRGAVVVPILDARKMDVYSACFDLSDKGTVKRITPDGVMRPEVLIEELNRRESHEGVLFLGAGLGVYSKMMEEGIGDKAVVLPEDLWKVRASNVALLAERMIGSSGLSAVGLTAAELTPLYIRRSEVEFKKTAAH